GLVGAYQDSEAGTERHAPLPHFLRGDLLTSCSIGEPLSLYSFQSAIGAFQIINSEGDPVVVTKVKFGGVAVEMRLGNVEIAAVNAALEDREEVLDRVGVPEIGTNVLLSRMVYPAMSSEFFADWRVDGIAVRHQITGLVNVTNNNRLKSLRG